MSRLDRHVAFVQNKHAISRFVDGLAWALLVYAAVICVAVVVDRLAHVRPPRAAIWLLAGLGVAVLAALAFAVIRRPSPEQAAVAIDDRLGLKEKFSTALYVRPLNDPFAQAAVRDAEQTADNVSLYKRFPIEWPRMLFATFAVALLALGTFWWLPSMDLLGREQAMKNQQRIEQQKEQARNVVKQALCGVNATPHGVADEDVVKRAQHELQNVLNQPMHDPEAAKRSAAKALEDVGQSIKQQMMSSQRFADAQNDARSFKSLLPTEDEKGPVADARRAIAKGDFEKAVDELDKTVEKFDQMSEQQKQKSAQQMQQMAQQLQQMAANPNVQKQIQQQLQQQMGMNQQQAQQMAQQMQQAAQGNKQAQQQLQQQAQQMLKQMNGGQGPTQQQQQQMQQLMNRMQAMANSQQQAQQMAQAAQQMAQAMKQQAQNGNQSRNGNQQSSQQMSSAKQAMQQQLQAMQAMQSDAKQIAAAQQAAQAAAQDAAAACNGGQAGPGKQGAGNQAWAGNNPQWRQGPNNNGNPQPNQGMGGFGIGAGPRPGKDEAPYAVKEVISPSEDIEHGKILASTLIRAKSVKGKSTVGLQEVAKQAEQEATDEVEEDRISRQAQQTVKEYFRSMEDDSSQQQ